MLDALSVTMRLSSKCGWVSGSETKGAARTYWRDCCCWGCEWLLLLQLDSGCCWAALLLVLLLLLFVVV